MGGTVCYTNKSLRAIDPFVSEQIFCNFLLDLFVSIQDYRLYANAGRSRTDNDAAATLRSTNGDAVSNAV